MRRIAVVESGGLAVLACAVLLAMAPAAGATNFVVDSTADQANPAPDGTCASPCTLREAVQAADFNPDPDVITLPAGGISLTIGPAGTASAATGDLDVTAPLTITGAGAGTTTIDAAGLHDRVFDTTSGTSLTLESLTVANGDPGSQDGGDIEALGPLTLQGVEVTGGTGSDGGGVFAADTLDVTDSHVHDNDHVSNGDGGGIYAGGPLTLTRVTVDHNGGAGDGGGVYVFNTATVDAATLTDVVVASNHTDSGDGAGLYLFTPATLTRVVVTGNSAGNAASSFNDGGGVYSEDTLTMRDVAVVGNTMHDGNGAGVYMFGSGDSLTNVTVTGNTFAAGDGEGGGLYADGSDLLLTNVTLAGNTAASGSALTDNAQIVSVSNTILGGSCDSPVASQGSNIGSDATCGLTAAGDHPSTDPHLGAQSAESSTIVLPELDGSPAIDAGKDAACPPADQRGVARPQGAHCDIGAYERAGASGPGPGPGPSPGPPSGAVPISAPAPTVTAPSTRPTAAQVIRLPSSRACVSRRRFRIRLRHPHGVRLVSATVRVNGKRVEVLKGRRLTSVVDLRGLPKGRFTVRITVVTSTGQRLSATRRYHTCTRKRRSKHPPKL